MDTSTNLGQSPKVSAKDFFLHLGSIVALYVVAGNFINLLFKIINQAYPEVAQYYYFGGGSEISLPVATLIVVFPVFVFLSRTIHHSYEVEPEKKNLGIRKWLTYITLFVAGVMLVADLVTVLYKFLDGQDLTLAFLLKALVVLVVSAAVFGFYLQDIRERVSAGYRKIFALIILVLIIASVVLGFGVIGSPKTQRLIRLDNQKITDLQNIEWQVINYWQVNGMIPETWSDMMIDTQTGQSYEYKKTGNMTFQLCAQFNRESVMRQGQSVETLVYPPTGIKGTNNDWSHGVGIHCFDREVDPVAYPTQIKG